MITISFDPGIIIKNFTETELHHDEMKEEGLISSDTLK
jgi:hypothetical protein